MTTPPPDKTRPVTGLGWKSGLAGCFAGLALAIGFGVLAMGARPAEWYAELPIHDPTTVIPNHDWFGETAIEITDYAGDAMEVGISPDSRYLLFNDNVKGDKDLHWALRVDDQTYAYRGRVRNTVSPRVDGTPSFDGTGALYFTTLKQFHASPETIYRAGFAEGAAIDPQPVKGNLYVIGRNGKSGAWVSLDPDISSDGRLLVYSEGRFNPRLGLPYPFNVRGAKRAGTEFVKLDDRLFARVNTRSLEYAPAISDDGRELFFSRISRVNDRPAFVGIYTARRRTLDEPFGLPQRIMAITGDVEAPVLSGDEKHLYYHRKHQGRFSVFRVTRRD